MTELFTINKDKLPDYNENDDKGWTGWYLDELLHRGVLSIVEPCEHGKIDEHPVELSRGVWSKDGMWCKGAGLNDDEAT